MDIFRPLSDFRSFIINILATKFHFLLLLGIVAGITLTYGINRLDYAVRALIYVIPGILIMLIVWNLYRKDEKCPDTLILLKPYRNLFKILFVSLFILSILSLYFSSYRPWYYFVLVTALYGLIFLQIFSDAVKPSSILFEISLVMGNIMFGLQLKYPFFFGYTDIIPHSYFAKIIFLSGHTIPLDLDWTYAWFPLFHIFIAEGTNLLGIELNYAYILLTSLCFIALVWVLFLLFRQITKNVQASLFMILIFSTTPVVIQYSTYVVTRVMAFIGFIFFLYLAHRQIQTSNWRSFSVLTIIFSLYLILVHQVSIIQILFLLFMFIFIELLIDDYFAIKTKIIALIIVTSSTYWLFTSFFFSSYILQTIDTATITGMSETLAQVAPENVLIFLRENVTTTVIIFFVILGSSYLLWAKKSKYPAVIGLFALIMIPLYFPSPVTASAMAMITFRIDRFSLLLSPFFAFALATGFLLFLFLLHKNRYTRKIAVFFGVLIFSYLCLSAFTVETASDSPYIASDQIRQYFTESEMDAFSFIPQYVPYNSTISSDKIASRMFERRYFSETTPLALPSYNPTSLLYYTKAQPDAPDTFAFEEGFFVLRNLELEEHQLGFESKRLDYMDTFKPTPDILSNFSDMTYLSQKIYDNRKVTILST
jgi:hypothetical protein